MAVDQDTKATGTYVGLDLKAPTKKPININKWMTAELFMKPLPSGCSVQFWYQINKTGGFVQAKVADGNNAFTTASGKKAVFSIACEGEIFEPKIVLVPSANTCPEVYRARIYFN